MSSSNDNAAGASGFAEQLQKLRANPRVPLILAVAAAAAILVGVFLWSTTGNYGVLFSGLSDQSGGKIVAQLDKMNVPYKFRAGGSTIMVPAGDVDQVRLQLASDGLPKRGGVGFGLMDDEPLGISKFAEHVNYQRALQGELARSIRTIDVIANARVNLAMPESSIFVQQRRHAKASVVISLYAGRSLSAGQVRSIQHLVASSVSRLPVDAVTVVNSDGTLLSRPATGAGGASASHLTYTAKVERAYRKKIDALLAPILGRDNFRVQVNANLNFTQNEKTRQLYAPNQNGHDAAVRSTQQQYDVSGPNAGKGGIPGALSNQPTPDTPSPINNPAQNNQNGGNNPNTGPQNTNNRAPQNGSGNASAAQSSDTDHGNRQASKSSTTNYELDHTVEHIKQSLGRLDRITAAVVINAKAPAAKPSNTSKNTNTDAAASTQSTNTAASQNEAITTLSKQQLAHIKTLVRSAIGYSNARGDVVSVLRSPFNTESANEQPNVPPWWQDNTIQSLVIKLLTYLVVAIVAFLVWRKILKPLVDSAARPRRPALAQAPAGLAETPRSEEPEAPEMDPAEKQREQQRKRHSEAVSNAKDVAQDDPRMVAMIIKNWMRNNDE